MNPEHAALWERIEVFDIDGGPAPALRFADRLARENSWSGPFAGRAVREYKRFVFLTGTAGRPVCPRGCTPLTWRKKPSSGLSAEPCTRCRVPSTPTWSVIRGSP